MVPLIWFANISDPSTVRQLRHTDIPAVLGATARITAASVEITHDPVVIDLDKKLPWYPELARQQKRTGVFSHPGQFTLTYSAFIRE